MKPYLILQLLHSQLGLCAMFMAAEVGDVATVQVLLSYQPDLSICEVVSLHYLCAVPYPA